jgi:hypothetical protein
VIYPSIGNSSNKKNIHIFRERKGKNKPSSPKNRILAQKSVYSCDISINREFNIHEENTCFKG